MRVTKLTEADYRRMPWKNGGGMTTELLAEPKAGDGFQWRISIAEVAQSGPFSDFTGYDRTIMLLEGAGFTLAFHRPTAADSPPQPSPPSKRLDKPLEPYRFPGEWQTHCTLVGGPVRDFNLIARRDGPRAVLDVLRLAPGSRPLQADPTTIVHLIDGDAVLAGQPFAKGETLRIDQADAEVPMVSAKPLIAVVIRIGGA